MRYVLPLLAVLSLGFAPLPFPNPGRATWVKVPLKYLAGEAVAPEVQRLLGPVGKVQVDVRSNTLFVKGRREAVDRVVEFIRVMDSLDKPLIVR